MRKPAVMTLRVSSRPHWSNGMGEPNPRKRKAAVPQTERTLKTSLVMGAQLHLQLSAAASMAGKDRNALAVEILTDALRGIIVVDRRRSTDRSTGKDRLTLAPDVENSEPEAA